MEQPVAHRGLVDIARFRILDPERRISSVPINFFREVMVKGENVIHKLQRKRLYVTAAALTLSELAP